MGITKISKKREIDNYREIAFLSFLGQIMHNLANLFSVIVKIKIGNSTAK